jgi:hypothetical protein
VKKKKGVLEPSIVVIKIPDQTLRGRADVPIDIRHCKPFQFHVENKGFFPARSSTFSLLFIAGG